MYKSKAEDVDGIKHVINFDFPQSSEDYIHRIGRTGRSETTGKSYAFFTRNNSKQSKALVEVLREANQEINPKLEDMARTCRDFGGGFRRWGGGSGKQNGTFKKGSMGGGNRFGGGNQKYNNGNFGDQGYGNKSRQNDRNDNYNNKKHLKFDE